MHTQTDAHTQTGLITRTRLRYVRVFAIVCNVCAPYSVKNFNAKMLLRMHQSTLFHPSDTLPPRRLRRLDLDVASQLSTLDPPVVSTVETDI